MADNNDLKITAGKMKVSEVDNTELVNAIKAMRANFTNETQNKVINLALKATFFVPARIFKNTELVADKDNKVKFEDKQQARFLLISHPERGTYFPAYTSAELLKGFKTDQEYQSFAMRFADLANLTEKTPSVNGFVIDPDTDNLPFTKQILDGIKRVILEARKKAQEAGETASEESKPNITVSEGGAGGEE